MTGRLNIKHSHFIPFFKVGCMTNMELELTTEVKTPVLYEPSQPDALKLTFLKFSYIAIVMTIFTNSYTILLKDSALKFL